ncbi:MAG: YycH family protein [Bacillota bacterium]|nr:MAG: YycH family protein [Bacillota bacterium]MBS3949871.1 hypothetical protein [Peptococcaceae bacterium]
MRERLKSILLIVAICTSFYMTAQLWINNYSPPSQASAPVDVIEPEPLDVLAPAVINLHQPSLSRQFSPSDLGFEAAWSAFRQIISGAPSVNVSVTTELEWKKALAGGSIELKLAGIVQLRMWLEALSIQPSGLSNYGFSFDRVLLSATSNDIYFWDTLNATYLIWDSVSPKEHPSRVKDDVAKTVAALHTLGSGHALRQLDPPYRALAAPWVYIPRSSGAWPQLWARGEKGKSQQVANGFFTDMSFVRKIEQRDGSLHFTDGSRGVYLESDGAVYYYDTRWFSPKRDNIHANASLILSSGLKFVAIHGGWPGETRLKRMEMALEQGVPYIHFEFTPFTTVSIGGVPQYVPIVSFRQQISLNVTERLVSEYERFVYVPLQTGASPLPVLAAEAALRVAEEHLKLDVSITDMYLAYYQRDIDQTEELLFPVWVIEQGAYKVLVHGYIALVINP